MRTVRGSRTFTCSSALLPNRRVKPDPANPGGVIYAGATDVAIGVTEGDPTPGPTSLPGTQTWLIAVISRKTEDRVEIEANDTIAVGQDVYGSANGRVSSSSAYSAVLVGTNFNANVVAGANCAVDLY